MKVGGSEEEEEEEDVFLPFEVFLPRFRVRSRRRPTMVMLWWLECERGDEAKGEEEEDW